jgi:DNA-binding PadR family transcriptional regulator
LQERLGPAWAINSGQVSTTIRQMEAEGLIERVDRPADVHGKRQFFEITERGVEDCERWRASETPTARLTRRPLLVKLMLAGPDRLKEALEQIVGQERELAEQLKDLSRMFREVPDDGLQVRADHAVLRLGLSADILELRAELDWLRQAHQMVSWLMARDAVWPSATERPGGLSEEAQKRRAARAELFGRMRDRSLRAVSDEEAGDE